MKRYLEVVAAQSGRDGGAVRMRSYRCGGWRRRSRAAAEWSRTPTTGEGEVRSGGVAWMDACMPVVAGSVDFATASAGLSDAQASAHPNVAMYPILCSALVPIYHLDALGVNAAQLVISRDALAAVYLGEVVWWNDSRLQATNSVAMPKQRIAMVLPTAGSARTTIWTTALGKFSSDFAAAIPPSASPVWPYSNYATWQQQGGTAGQATAVVATDGSIVFAFQSVALQMSAQQFAMVNLAGKTVQASTASVTFAAVELGTQERERSTDTMDLTDGAGSSVWPISLISFLVLDTQYSPSTCGHRAALVQFWLWFYSSSVVAGILDSRQYAPVPDVVLGELNVLDALSTQVMCRGNVALPLSSTTTRIMGVPSLPFISGLFANLYLDVDSTVQWQVQSNSDEVTLMQLLGAEIDIAFVNPRAVDADVLQATVDDPTFLLLPTYLVAPAMVYNTQITANVSIASYQLSLSLTSIGLIFLGCISAWNHPRVLAENPWLAPLLPPLSVTAINITTVLSCSLAAASLGIIDALTEYGSSVNDSDSNVCINAYFTGPGAAAAARCVALPGQQALYVAGESAVVPMLLGVQGSVGLSLASGDASYGTVQLLDVRGGVVVSVSPDVSGMEACADAFQDQLLMTDTAPGLLSTGQRCYRPTQQVVAVLRQRYSSTAADASGCDRGYDALNFLQWFYSTQLIDALVNNVDVARVNNLSPAIHAAYTAALNAVTCDGVTLLSTAPNQWSLNAGITAFVQTLAAVGLLATAALCAFIFRHRHHPVVRSASPMFLLLTVCGVGLIFVSGFLLVAGVTTASCAGFSWLINVGLMLTFAPLFAKTWRVYRIFGRKKLKVVSITNARLLLLCVAMLSLELALMAVWQAVGNLQPVANDVTTSQQVTLAIGLDQPRFYVDEYLQCGVPSGASRSMFAVLVVEKSLLFAFGALMAFTTRRVSSTYNESSGIALAIYNVCFTLGIIAPIILVISAVGDVLTLLLAFALLWIAFFTGGILMVPKVMQIVYHTDNNGQANRSIQASSSSATGYEFMSLVALANVPVLRTYQSAVLKHLEQVEHKIALLVRNGAAATSQLKSPSRMLSPSTSARPRQLSMRAAGGSEGRDSDEESSAAPATITMGAGKAVTASPQPGTRSGSLLVERGELGSLASPMSGGSGAAVAREVAATSSPGHRTSASLPGLIE